MDPLAAHDLNAALDKIRRARLRLFGLLFGSILWMFIALTVGRDLGIDWPVLVVPYWVGVLAYGFALGRLLCPRCSRPFFASPRNTIFDTDCPHCGLPLYGERGA